MWTCRCMMPQETDAQRCIVCGQVRCLGRRYLIVWCWCIFLLCFRTCNVLRKRDFGRCGVRRHVVRFCVRSANTLGRAPVDNILQCFRNACFARANWGIILNAKTFAAGVLFHKQRTLYCNSNDYLFELCAQRARQLTLSANRVNCRPSIWKCILWSVGAGERNQGVVLYFFMMRWHSSWSIWRQQSDSKCDCDWTKFCLQFIDTCATEAIRVMQACIVCIPSWSFNMHISCQFTLCRRKTIHHEQFANDPSWTSFNLHIGK